MSRLTQTLIKPWGWVSPAEQLLVSPSEFSVQNFFLSESERVPIFLPTHGGDLP